MQRFGTCLSPYALALAVTAMLGASSTVHSAPAAFASVAQPTHLRQGDAVVGALPASTPVHVDVALRLRNRAGLDAFIAARSRGGPVMDHATFMAHHAPDVRQVSTVVAYLRAQGFVHIRVAPDRLLVGADATAAIASRAFATTLEQVRTRSGRFAIANSDAVRVPAALQDGVLGVLGLQTVYRARPFVQVTPQAVKSHDPTEFSAIYGGTGVAVATGVTVGIVSSGQMAQVNTDLKAFTSAHGLPALPTQTVTIDGTSSATDGVAEWDMASQALIGSAGGGLGKLIWYNVAELSDADLADAYDAAVDANSARVIDLTFGGCESSANISGAAAVDDQIFASAVVQGQTFVTASSGAGEDLCGNGGNTPSWPSSSQYVIAVAGTTLDATSTRWRGEAAWPDAAAVQSSFEPRPAWQTRWKGKHRAPADLAFDADPQSGARVRYGGQDLTMGGSGLAASIFAGQWARMVGALGATVGFAGPQVYAMPGADFHDIKTGSPSAKPGFDLASGRGSMVLAKALIFLKTAPAP